ncbi:Apm2p NDAI_0B01610 [Naumovozyma dairenensis CBS 421]|uniref:MHD domain-containing protein n=1 Tax=Naumovozyma dairenensis (strain ATCC 10597 / BCRC 20456 / CBS 421 / NBRC 0211 / NRRL Y-12639) TaxID=1071378 RepID=G0W5Y4_NAUDC|nr:hypothetical protein NDAI_0B01610 [Naumovozyma dairenensis CBS 421]CCD23195.1 hypothetical protein NDAI_0B01610 [Naumovozyma dairenensis CBS 421]
MSSCIFILDENLEPILNKNIRSIGNNFELLLKFQEIYRKQQNEIHNNDDSKVLPILNTNDYGMSNSTNGGGGNCGWQFLHIKRDSLIFVSIIENNSMNSLMIIFSYLEEFYKLLKSYLNVTKLDKGLLIDNFLLVMELLDESLDFGIVQFTDSSLIKDYIRVKINLPELNYDGSRIDGNDEVSSDDDDDNKHKRKHKHKHKHEKSKAKGKQADNVGTGAGAGLNLSNLTKLEKDKILETIKKNKDKVLDGTRLRIGGGNRQDTDTDTDIELGTLGEGNNDIYMNSYIAKTTIMPISWRTKGIHYAKNEFFLDVIEKVEYFMDFEKGLIRKNLIHGEIVCKCYLSGMPKLKISINKILQNDSQFLSNAHFHQCVSLDSLHLQSAEDDDGDDNANVNENENHDERDRKKEIEFIPPDGDFLLCKYELKRHVKDLPVIKLKLFDIKPKLSKYKLKIHVIIETHFKTTNNTSKLNLKIPIERLFQEYRIDLSKQIKFKCDQGKVLFNLSDNFLIWEIGSMKGGHGEVTMSMMAEFPIFNEEEYERLQEEMKTSMNPPPLREGPKLEELYKKIHHHNDEDEDEVEAEVEAEEEEEDVGSQEATGTHARKTKEERKDKDLRKRTRSPNLLKIDFEIPYYTCSGLKIEYLKIEEPQLQYQSFPWVRYKTISDEEYAYIV